MIGFLAKTGEFLVAFTRDERGATAIEYGLIASGIFVAIIVAVNTMASSVNEMFEHIGSSVASAI